MDIDQLLRQSIQAHDAARALRVAGKDWKPRAVVARDLRLHAESLDPERLDPAWEAERVREKREVHFDLLVFYQRHLS